VSQYNGSLFFKDVERKVSKQFNTLFSYFNNYFCCSSSISLLYDEHMDSNTFKHL